MDRKYNIDVLRDIDSKLDGLNSKDLTSTIYGESTETKPDGNIKGDKYFEIDTGEVFMWNNTSWVVI